MIDESKKEINVVCQGCLKQFSLRGYNLHKEKCTSTTCKFCNHKCINKRNLDYHLTICKKHLEFLLNENEQLKEEKEKLSHDYDLKLKQLKEEKEKLSQDHDLNLNVLKEKHDKEVNFLKMEIKSLKQTVSDQKSQISEFISNIKPSIVNNNTNITNQLCLTLPKVDDQEIYSVLNDIFGREVLPDNEVDFAKAFCEEFMKDKGFVADRSRHILVWMNNDQKQIRDRNGIEISRKVFSVGEPIFKEKKEELFLDIKAVRENNVLMQKLLDWRDCITAYIRKDGEKLVNFGKTVVSLSQDKNIFMLNNPKESGQTPLLSLFEKMFQEKNIFKGFCRGYEGFGNFVKEYFDKCWLICDSDYNAVEFRFDPDKNPVVVTLEIFIELCAPFINESLKQTMILNFSNFEDNIYAYIDGQEVCLSRKQASSNILQLCDTLQNTKAEEWYSIFSVLLT